MKTQMKHYVPKSNYSSKMAGRIPNDSKTYSAVSNSFYDGAVFGGIYATAAKVDHTDQKRGNEDLEVTVKPVMSPKKQSSGILPHKKATSSTRKSPSSRFGSPTSKSLSPTRRLTASGRATNT